MILWLICEHTIILVVSGNDKMILSFKFIEPKSFFSLFFLFFLSLFFFLNLDCVFQMLLRFYFYIPPDLRRAHIVSKLGFIPKCLFLRT